MVVRNDAIKFYNWTTNENNDVKSDDKCRGHRQAAARMAGDLLFDGKTLRKSMTKMSNGRYRHTDHLEIGVTSHSPNQ